MKERTENNTYTNMYTWRVAKTERKEREKTTETKETQKRQDISIYHNFHYLDQNDVCIYICIYGQIGKIPCITEEKRMEKNQHCESYWKNPSGEQGCFP